MEHHERDYQRYKATLEKVADLNNAAALLNWDQETYMPPLGGKYRARQLSTIAGISHELYVDDEFTALLDRLQKHDQLEEEQRRNVKETVRDQGQSKRYPTDFVKKLSHKVSKATQTWQKAREKDDFSLFAPDLKEIVDLKRRECDILGYEDHPYDALLDQFEPGKKTKDVDELFTAVKTHLGGLTKTIADKEQNDDSFMYRSYEKDKQWEFGLMLLEQMGYDFQAGRQDASAHPFTISFSPQDVRVTTRIDENDLNEMIWSCIHEGGHGLYEQGMNAENYGLPAGEACSLGIHESQARLWENIVGRGLPFWKANYQELKEHFPENLKNVSLEDFYKGMNLVQPSLIRTNADELTYHFHILIRFEIEKALMEGEVKVDDLPELWNAKYKEYLNVDVPSDASGVLQDVHWSHGGMGYFPTYSLGSFYSAQFYAQALKDMPELEERISRGELLPLREWLKEHIHQYGRLYKADELCEGVTGEKLNFNYFLDYAAKKYSHIYDMEPIWLDESEN